MKILVISSGNIVQLAKYPRYFASQGHECVFINPKWSNALCGRTVEDEFGGMPIRFYTWEEFNGVSHSGEFDCIFGTQHGAAEQVLKYQKEMGIPALLQILDIADERLPDQLAVQKGAIKTYSEIMRLTGINPAIPQQVKQLVGRDDCSCVFYPVDTELFDSVSDQDTEDFVFIVSRHASFKRVDLAIRACAYAGARLVLASGNDPGGSLRKLAQELNFDAQFLGYISDVEKARWMKRCKLHIFTQMWAEAPCIPSAEALYCNKPSIIFDYPAQRVIEGAFSRYVPPGDWKAMGEEIVRVYDNYNEELEFAKAGHVWVKDHLAPNVVAKQILDILVNMVNEGRKDVEESHPA